MKLKKVNLVTTLQYYWWYFTTLISGFDIIKVYPGYRAIRWTPEEMEEQEEYFLLYPEKETIVASAIKARDGTVWAVMSPGRHHHCIYYMAEHKAAENSIKGNTRHQGFMTNTNRYVGRKEAMKIAIASGQYIPRNYGHPELAFSEDLWETPPHFQHPRYQGGPEK